MRDNVTEKLEIITLTKEELEALEKQDKELGIDELVKEIVEEDEANGEEKDA